MLQPIATLRTCYPDKFGVPRQSGLVPQAWGVIEFESAFRRAEAVRGIEGFSHLWLITQFHQVKDESVGLTVRPPRLGGNERRGVYATRSPFRPNRLGLSVVKLERVEADIPRLHVNGVDMVDGTPIFDIKPYVPYADCVPGAVGSFASAAPQAQMVTWAVEVDLPALERSIIEQSLALQPQPAYQEASARKYATEIAGWHVEWQQEAALLAIVECRRG
jgi:tRNA-Thr(GGU) m(6)t(6)A37 methyltransferase TsaA